MGKHKLKPSNTIALNKKARFDYQIEQTFESGIALLGWEVKSLRSGKANITESYVLFKDNQAYLFGANFLPLGTASSHIQTDPIRTRTLLLNRREINKLRGQVDIDGKTVVPLELYWSKGKVKVTIGLAKGKKQHDKRASEKDRDWNRDKQRILKSQY